MIGLTLTVTVSNVRTSIENSMEVQVLVLIFLGLLRSGGRSMEGAACRAQHCDGHQRFPGSGPDNDIALFGN